MYEGNTPIWVHNHSNRKSMRKYCSLRWYRTTHKDFNPRKPNWFTKHCTCFHALFEKPSKLNDTSKHETLVKYLHGVVHVSVSENLQCLRKIAFKTSTDTANNHITSCKHSTLRGIWIRVQRIRYCHRRRLWVSCHISCQTTILYNIRTNVIPVSYLSLHLHQKKWQNWKKNTIHYTIYGIHLLYLHMYDNISIMVTMGNVFVFTCWFFLLNQI